MMFDVELSELAYKLALSSNNCSNRNELLDSYGLLFEPSRPRYLGKKSKNIACDITVGTNKLKSFVQLECWLGYIMMLI